MIRFMPATQNALKWANQHIECSLAEDARGIIALRDDIPVAAYILQNWTETSVQAHQAILDPLVLKHGFFEEVLKYIFDEAGRELIIGLTPADNAKAVKLNRHYGFKEHSRIPNAVRLGVDMIIFTMHRDECSYYEGNRHAA